MDRSDPLGKFTGEIAEAWVSWQLNFLINLSYGNKISEKGKDETKGEMVAFD